MQSLYSVTLYRDCRYTLVSVVALDNVLVLLGPFLLFLCYNNPSYIFVAFVLTVLFLHFTPVQFSSAIIFVTIEICNKLHALYVCNLMINEVICD